MTAGSVDRQWPIVGVVGLSGKADPSLRNLAKDVGTELVTSGCAVLTGGDHRHPEESVKYHALLGATEAAQVNPPARLIGILPGLGGKQAPSPEPSPQGEQPVRYVYGHTGLESAERDEIIGKLGDGQIALEGESGTPLEVAWALRARRRVVFLNSRAALEKKVRGWLEQWGEPADELLANAQDAGSAAEAVKKVLDRIHRPYQGCIDACNPADKSRPQNPTFKEQFDKALSQL